MSPTELIIPFVLGVLTGVSLLPLTLWLLGSTF
jgi:hypothetical protein